MTTQTFKKFNMDVMVKMASCTNSKISWNSRFVTVLHVSVASESKPWKHFKNFVNLAVDLADTHPVYKFGTHVWYETKDT